MTEANGNVYNEVKKALIDVLDRELQELRATAEEDRRSAQIQAQQRYDALMWKLESITEVLVLVAESSHKNFAEVLSRMKAIEIQTSSADQRTDG